MKPRKLDMKPIRLIKRSYLKDRYISEYTMAGFYMDSDADNMWLIASFLYAELLGAGEEEFYTK